MIARIQRLSKTIKNKNKLYIFGAGKNGKELLAYLNRYNVSVEAFIDNNTNLKDIEDKEVITVNRFIEIAQPEDFILISCASYEEVEHQLKELGWNNYLYYREVPDIKEYVIDYDLVQSSGARTSWERAINWLLKYKQSNSGISYSNKELRAYPEVTGYLIPTLIDYGHYEAAKDCTKWLLTIQQEDGGFADINHTKEFVFDTAQILRGLLCFSQDVEIGDAVTRAVEKACDFLFNHMIDKGKGGYIEQYSHDHMIPETILLYTLPPLKKAAEVLGKEEYLEAVENCIHFYEMQDSFLRTEDLTHFLAYEIEALIDLGRTKQVEKVLEELFSAQMEDGAIPSSKGSKWICTPGTAQLALCELKLGRKEGAEKVLEWMRKAQMPGGGFWGSYGANARYFAGEEISWAVKYYLDAERLYIEKWFDDNTDEFPEQIEKEDKRYEKISQEVMKLGENSRIAEIGCGKGRFLKGLLEEGFQGEMDGYDISKELLKYVPDRVKTIHGRMEAIPCKDNEYDLVFCIEALEHSQNMQLAVSEMVRILKPEGKLIIIDKDKAYWGIMRCSEWENWIGKEELRVCMQKYLTDVVVDDIDKKMPYMLVWQGTKE